MKKDEFLKSLQARLVERGLSEASAEKETAHVRTYLSESSMEEVDISIDEMADGILAMLEDNSESEHEDIDVAPVPMVSEESDESVSDELSAAIAAIDSEPETTEDNSAPEESKEEEITESIAIPIVIEPEAEETSFETAQEKAVTEPVPEETKEEPSQSDEEESGELLPAEAELTPVIIPAEPAPKEEEEPEIPEDTAPAPQPSEQSVTIEEDADIDEYIPYNQKVKMKKIQNSKKGGNEWLYVLLLVVTIPLAVALILTAFVLYLGFWVVLALAMIACIAVLVVFVTVFALIAIVGIVYGVVQLITGNMPVGLFEIGLGVMIGAAVMFIGILIYNFAVRFIPFIMKLLARLFRAGFRGIRNGYQVLKGAVEEL